MSAQAKVTTATRATEGEATTIDIASTSQIFFDMRSPTARTLNFFRKLDCQARVVEQWIGFGKPKGFVGKPGVRRDLWGADILVKQGCALLAVQSTSGSNHSKRVEKSLANPEILNWLDCGVTFHVYSWAKKGPRGGRKVWTPRITQLVVDNGKVKVL